MAVSCGAGTGLLCVLVLQWGCAVVQRLAENLDTRTESKK